MRVTNRQIEIMTLVLGASIRGSWLDIDELMSLLASVGTKQSVQCSLRYLQRGKLIERVYGTRRGAKRCIVVPTPLGFTVFSGKRAKETT